MVPLLDSGRPRPDRASGTIGAGRPVRAPGGAPERDQADGSDFRAQGVYVANGGGFLGAPARKKPKQYEYPDHNGYLPDLEKPVYEARTITLDCFLVTDTAAELVTRFTAFSKALLGVTGLVPFSVALDGANIFSAQVYTSAVSNMTKTFVDGRNVGTFKVTIIEPEPTV